MRNRQAGAPDKSLPLMPVQDISSRLGISTRRVEQILSSAMRKLQADGQIDALIALTVKRANPDDFRPFIRCGSIECRPEKWVFHA